MTRKLLIDEDSQAKVLVTLLKQAGYDVLTVNEAGLSGQPDSVVFEYACLEGRLVLTRNYDDFQALHEANPIHPAGQTHLIPRNAIEKAFGCSKNLWRIKKF